LFKKGQVLFQYHRARREIRKSQTAVLLEGYMDVMSAWQAGLHNCVASLGTSFSEEHALLLKRSAERLVIAYDGDDAGRKAARRALEVAEPVGLDVRVLLFPAGVDPDEFVQAHGAEAFVRYVEAGARSPVEFLIEEARARANLSTSVGRTDFIREALHILASRGTPIEQEAAVKRLANEFEVSVSTLMEELALISKQVSKERRVKRRSEPLQRTPVRVVNGAVRAGERILQGLFTDPQAFHTLMERGVDELATEEQTALLALFYSFRAEHPDGDAAAFIDQLDDPQLRGYASSLLIDAMPEFHADVLEDYLRTIRLHQLQAQLLMYAKQSDEARRQGDESTAEALGAQVEACKSAIAQLKSPHSV
jgi:DNA primase